ncbi:MAG TPA: DUF2911 domain-containing protein [Chitinophagaceae bacterium]|nr:DUF2911 domain-containing protein [Chitinophagaceae bacterium]
MKKPQLLLPALLFLLSCNSNEEKATTPSTPTKPDSSIRSNNDASINPYAQVDISPMDMAYYPPDYPKLKMAKATTAAPLARVIYSRPHLQGRQIFHEILNYGVPWRLGANESSEIDLYKDITIQGKPIKAGRYVIYCIPQEKEWTIILNSNIDTWGLQPDPKQDIARFTAPVTTTDNSLEYFTMVFAETSKGADLLMAWDNIEVRLPVNF